MKTAKKIFVTVAMIIISAMCLVFSASAERSYYEQDGYTYYIHEDFSVITEAPQDLRGDVVIPDELGGMPVAVIGDYAFSDLDEITSVVFPEHLEVIYNYAFRNCSALSEVTFPEAFRGMNDGAFDNCESLESIHLPKNVVSVGYGSFAGCSSLRKITLDPENEYLSVQDNVLFNKDKTELIVFPGGLIKSHYTVPSTVKRISYLSFCMSNVDSLDTGDGVEVIDLLAFYRSNIKNITFGKSVYLIDERAFNACENLTKIKLPDNVRELGAGAFSGCISAESIEIGAGITTVSESAFDACIGAKKVIIPKTVTDIEYRAFCGLRSLERVYYTGTQSQWQNISIGYFNDELEQAPREYNYNPNVLGRPEKITSVQNTTAISLSWTPVEGAQFYRIFVRNANGWRVLNDVTEPTQLYKNLKVATKFTFAVRAGKIINGKKVLAPTYSTYETSTAAIAPAKIASAQNTSAIKLAWTACPGATGYRIFFKTENGWTTCLSSTTKTSHTFTRLQPGSKFTFAVRPYIRTSNTIVWSAYSTYVATTQLPPVDLKLSSLAKGQVTLEWNAVSGADAYRIFCSLDGGKTFKVYKNQTACKLVINNLVVGRAYTFAVRAAASTSSGYVWDYTFKPKSITVKCHTQALLQNIKDCNFEVGYTVNGSDAIIAAKDGKICLMGVDYEGDWYRMVYDDDIEMWYFIYDDYGSYTEYTDEDIGFESGTAQALLNSYRSVNPNKTFTIKNTTVGGNLYTIESCSYTDRVTSFTYVNNRLIQIKTAYKTGDVTTIDIKYFTNNVSSDRFEVPDDYYWYEPEE